MLTRRMKTLSRGWAEDDEAAEYDAAEQGEGDEARGW